MQSPERPVELREYRGDAPSSLEGFLEEVITLRMARRNAGKEGMMTGLQVKDGEREFSSRKVHS